MEDHNNSEFLQSGGWPWLSFFAVVGALVISRSTGTPQLLFGVGFLLLGVFSYYHNPLTLAQRPVGSMALAHKVSVICGIAGIVCLVAAAVSKWV